MNYNYGNYGYPQQGVNNFQGSYQQIQNPTQMNPQMNPQINPQISANQPINEFVWVQGEMEAKMYPVGAGKSVILMDSENPILYMKTRDSTGKYLPIEVYDLVKRENVGMNINAAVPEIDLSGYVKIDDLDRIIDAKVKAAVDKALE